MPEDESPVSLDIEALTGDPGDLPDADAGGASIPILSIGSPSSPVTLISSLGAGAYTMEEDALLDNLRALLHGRAYVVDRDDVTENTSSQPRQYYVASDTAKGLIIPARSMAVENAGAGLMHYRWTDDGSKWTGWVTLDEGETHSYRTEEKCRFAEIQVYCDTPTSYVSIRATR